MRTFIRPACLLLTLFVPFAALALENTYRVTFQATVEQVNITEQQAFDRVGGEFSVRSEAGELVHVLVSKDTLITVLGRPSRKQVFPLDLRVGTQATFTGLKTGEHAIDATVIIVTKIEGGEAPELVNITPTTVPVRGEVKAIGADSITISADGEDRVFSIVELSRIIVRYSVLGIQGLSLIGRQVTVTPHPARPSEAKIVRITARASSAQQASAAGQLQTR